MDLASPPCRLHTKPSHSPPNNNYSFQPEPDAIARGSFVRHLVGASAEECQHTSEAVSPASSATISLCRDSSHDESSPGTIVDKGKGRGDEYFLVPPPHVYLDPEAQTPNTQTSGSQNDGSVSTEEVERGEIANGDSWGAPLFTADDGDLQPRTPVRHEGWGNGVEGPYWGTASDHEQNVQPRDDGWGGDDNASEQNVDAWGERHNPSAPQAPGGWGASNAQDADWGGNNHSSQQDHCGEWGQTQPNNGDAWNNQSSDHNNAGPRFKQKSASYNNLAFPSHQNKGWRNRPTTPQAFQNHNQQGGWSRGNMDEDGKVFEAGQNGGWGQSGHDCTENCFWGTTRCRISGKASWELRGHVRQRHGSHATLRPPFQFNQHQNQQEQRSPHHHHSRDQQSQYRTPQQHYRHNHPRETHQHHYSHNRNSHPQNVQSADQELVTELRTENAQQAELIVEQRIRIAVLENEAKYISKGKDDAVSATLIIAQTLGAAFKIQLASLRQTPRLSRNTRELSEEYEGEDEISELKGKLRKKKPVTSHTRINSRRATIESASSTGTDEDADDKKRKIVVISEQSWMGQRKHTKSRASPLSSTHSAFPRQTLQGAHWNFPQTQPKTDTHSQKSVHNGKVREAGTAFERQASAAKATDVAESSSQESATRALDEIFNDNYLKSLELQQAANKHRALCEKVISSSEGMRGAYEKDKALAAHKSLSSLGQAPASSDVRLATSTMPVAQASKNKGITGWDETFHTTTDIPTVPNSPVPNTAKIVSNRMVDVGINSLDDILNDGDEVLLPPDPVVQPGDHLLGDIDVDIITLEPALQAKMRILQNLQQVPAAKVFKTDTDLKNSFRGLDYDKAPSTSSNTLRNAPTGSHAMGDYNGLPDRTLTKDEMQYDPSTLFGFSVQDKEQIIKIHQQDLGRDGLRFPDYFRYGIKYIPHVDDENYMRTVSITGLPSDITLREVLLRVRGGKVASAHLMDLRKPLGGSVGAVIKFLEDYDAQAFAEYAADHPLKFDEDDETVTTQVEIVDTPTFPLNAGTAARVRANRDTSRCLRVPNFPRNLSLKKLHLDIAAGNFYRGQSLLEIFLDEEGTLHLEMATISLAGTVFGLLGSWGYRSFNMQVDYAPDPCCGPLEELELPIGPRPPLIPKNANGSFASDQEDADSSFESRPTRRPRCTQFRPPGEDAPHQRRLPLLPQNVVIPSFRGANLKSASWADEVEGSTSSGNPDGVLSGKPASYIYNFESSSSHLEALSNSPEGKDVKGVSSLPTIEETKRSMRENPSSNPTGLAGSRFAPVCRSTACDYTSSDAGNGKGKKVHTTKYRRHPELEPGRLLATALGSSESGNESTDSARSAHLPEDTIHCPIPPSSLSTPTQQIQINSDGAASSSPDLSSASNSTATPEDTRHKRGSSRNVSFSDMMPSIPEEDRAVSHSIAIRELEETPTREPKRPAGHTSPLEEFSSASDNSPESQGSSSSSFPSREQTIPQTPAPKGSRDNPHTPANTVATPLPVTPRKPGRGPRLRGGGPEESHAEAEWAKGERQKSREASPMEKEKKRDAKLVEFGRGVGESHTAELVPDLRAGGLHGPSGRTKDQGKGKEAAKANLDEIDLESDVEEGEKK